MSKGKWRLDVELECEKFSHAFIILFYFIVILLIILLFLLCYVVNRITWTSVLPQSCFGCCSQTTIKWRDGATVILVFLWLNSLTRTRPPHRRGFEITHRHTSLDRTPLDEESPVAEVSTWRNKISTRDRHPWPQRDSNPQSQQANGRRPTPQTAQPPGWAQL